MTALSADVGLDFGMTNSLLAYYHPGTFGPDVFAPKNSETHVVRTAVSDPDAPLMNRLIGLVAQHFSGFYQNFKIGLPRASVDPAVRRLDPEYRAAKAFLEALINDFCSSSPGGIKLSSIVVTVPESWISGAEQSGQEALLQIFEELELPRPRLLSEPVAASCYFADRLRRTAQVSFDGHVLVYDHGGGTLDLSLVRVDGPKIKVITGVGLARDMSSKGFGGVAFDRAVFEHLRTSHPGIRDCSLDKRDAWLQQFERCKREASPIIEKKVNAGDLNAVVFSVGEIPVRLADLLHVFHDSFSPAIDEGLDQILRHARTIQELDLTDPSRFRVVSVGGFSEFYPVQQLLSDFVSKHSGNPEVLRSYLSRTDKWQAIAKGACLVASNLVELGDSCPFTFGLRYYRGDELCEMPLIELGVQQSEYFEPKLAEPRFEINDLSESGDTSIIFYIERLGEQVPLPMKQTFAHTLPDYGRAATWQVGCFIRDRAVNIQIESDTGKRKNFRMGQFLSMVRGQIEEVELV